LQVLFGSADFQHVRVNVTKGLLDEFGPERIRDTPLSESAFVGAGIGAALGGMRPIVAIMTVNFSLLALDQIVNNAATIRHMMCARSPTATRCARRSAKRFWLIRACF
jgi:pyruvate/2-oxoglutarate/acetoin dehydrogenase E1 component